MARKNLLAGLTNIELPAGNSPLDPASGPSSDAQPSTLGQRGAIGAVTRSIEYLKSQIGEAKQIQSQLAAGQTVVELDPALIDHSFITDRMAHAAEELATLVESIRANGQQVPILVRPHPEHAGRFQVAYGHRRLRAAAVLAIKVRSVVKELSDAELVVAQGQENSARTDLSFLERALFAARLEKSGFDRETIMSALTIDKTALSKLVSVATKVPEDVLLAVGPAPNAGRDRWLAMVERFQIDGASTIAAELLVCSEFSTLDTDARFNRLFDALSSKNAKSQRSSLWTSDDGKKLGRIREGDRDLTVVIDKRVAPDFANYLVERLPELYKTFINSSAGSAGGGSKPS